MRLTQCLEAPIKRYWWGKGWGNKPWKDISHRMFKIQWKTKGRRKIFEHRQSLPPNAVVEDANQVVKTALQKEFSSEETVQKELPWPHSSRPIKGMAGDPAYQSKSALVFTRNRRLLDPLNQSLHFTNTVLEGDQQLPEPINRLMSDIDVDSDFIELLRRRLKWSTESDSTMRKLPLNRVFPHLDQRPPRVWGIPENRKEHNYLRTLYDATQIRLSQVFGWTAIHKISYPYCVVPFERDNKLVVLDLETDFITVTKRDNRLGLFSTSPLMTIDKPLASMEPLSWTTCFLEKNVYPTDHSFQMPTNHSIQTLYFTHNQLRSFETTSLVGRAIIYCYGYTTAMARLAFGEHIDGKEIPDPIPIQCVFINPKEFSLSFVCFQLNTTSFESALKNQVWIKTDVTDLSEVTKHLVSFQVNGFVDPLTNRLKESAQSV